MNLLKKLFSKRERVSDGVNVTAGIAGPEGQDATLQDSITALKHPDRNVRVRAARTLGKAKDQRAVEPLILALADSNEFVRMDAAWALGQIADNRAVQPLIHALRDPHGFVRREAALALGELDDARAVDPLIAVLEGDQGASAAQALFKITGEDYARILLSGRSAGIVYREAMERKLGDKRSRQVGIFEPDKLIQDHFVRVRAALPEDRGANWIRAVIQKVVDEELDNICLLACGKMNESLSDGERHSVSVLANDLFISISTFPCSVEEARRKHFPNGYLPYLDQMVNMGRQQNPRCHWLHLPFFWDGAQFWVQLTVFPNKHVLDFPPRYHLPIELLSDQEKSSVGLA